MYWTSLLSYSCVRVSWCCGVSMRLSCAGVNHRVDITVLLYPEEDAVEMCRRDSDVMFA